MGRYNVPNLTDQNEVSASIHLGVQSSRAIGIQTPSTNGAAAQVKLQGSMDDAAFGDIGTLDPADGVTMSTSLTGANKHGVVPVSTRMYPYIRVMRLDNTPAQACTVLISVAD